MKKRNFLVATAILISGMTAGTSSAAIPQATESTDSVLDSTYVPKDVIVEPASVTADGDLFARHSSHSSHSSHASHASHASHSSHSSHSSHASGG